MMVIVGHHEEASAGVAEPLVRSAASTSTVWVFRKKSTATTPGNDIMY